MNVAYNSSERHLLRYAGTTVCADDGDVCVYDGNTYLAYQTISRNINLIPAALKTPHITPVV